jgi:hypothetical protein
MFDKAAKASFLKAGYDVTYREKVDSLILAGEYNAKASKNYSAEEMFLRAIREGNSEQRSKVSFQERIFISLLQMSLKKREE